MTSAQSLSTCFAAAVPSPAAASMTRALASSACAGAQGHAREEAAWCPGKVWGACGSEAGWLPEQPGCEQPGCVNSQGVNSQGVNSLGGTAGTLLPSLQVGRVAIRDCRQHAVCNGRRSGAPRARWHGSLADGAVARSGGKLPLWSPWSANLVASTGDYTSGKCGSWAAYPPCNCMNTWKAQSGKQQQVTLVYTCRSLSVSRVARGWSFVSAYSM
jgi:hypothetical protein